MGEVKVGKQGCWRRKAPFEPPSAEPSPPLQHGPLSVPTRLLAVWTCTLTWTQRDRLALHQHQSAAVTLEWLFFTTYISLARGGRQGTWGEAAPVPRSCSNGTVSILFLLWRCFLPQKRRLTRNPPMALRIIGMEKARKGARTSSIKK